VESRDFGNGRWLRCRIGFISRRFVWPVSERPQESRTVKAPYPSDKVHLVELAGESFIVSPSDKSGGCSWRLAP
jgi:hypothetical protein